MTEIFKIKNDLTPPIMGSMFEGKINLIAFVIFNNF